MTMVLREPDGLQIQSLDDVERLARTAVASGLVAVRRAEEAVVLLLTGRELGLSPMQSLRGIYVVSGRPVLSADLMVAVIRRSGLCRSWRVLVSTAAECTIETQREGESEPARKTWTADDARRAGLGGKGTWAAYPAQMLRHRCAADLAREVYPDVLLGLYTPDEVERPEGAPAALPDPAAQEPQQSAPVVATVQPSPEATKAPETPSSAAQLPAEVPAALVAFNARVAEIELPGDAVAVWIKHRNELAPLSATDRESAWRSLCKRVEDVGKMTNAKVWLKKAIAERDAQQPDPPPDGTNGGAGRASGGSAANSQGGAAEGSAGDATSARVTTLPGVPEWATTPGGIRAHLASISAAAYLENSVRLHRRTLGPVYLELAAERLIALDGPDVHGSYMAPSTAKGMVGAWANAGPHPKAEPRRARVGR